MRKAQWLSGLALIGFVVSGLGGCVSLDKYRQLEMSHRTALAEKGQIEADLYDARSVADSLRTKLTATEGELGTKNQLIGNLQAENDRLEQVAMLAQQTLEQLARKAMPIDPVVITEPKLPPALDSALKQFAAQYPQDVEYNESTGAIKWKSDVLFALGSDVVKETATASLSRFGEILNSTAADDFEVIVVGHTDDRPIARESTRKAHPTNWHLSVHRAIAVAKIILNGAYDASRVGVMGYGQYRPIVSNDSEENRARNRRVQIYLVRRGSVLACTSADNIFHMPELGLVFVKARCCDRGEL
ncbi:MAG: OmpA family protein [Phycisphaerae bacterium]|nr:OmpA family protein [Phycisphaerae bacterium]